MGTELAVIEGSNYLALNGEMGGDLQEIIRENLGDEGLQPQDLSRVSIPTGGSTSWQLESSLGTDDFKELVGVIVAWGTTRTYWAVGVDEAEETTPPDCSSSDGLIGHGQFGVGSTLHPNGDCTTCPMNQWGSGADPEKTTKPGEGPKACREGKLLFIIREGDIIPVTVNCPPTSIKPFRQYMTDLVKAQKIFSSVVTKLTLTKVDNGAGIKWSEVKPTIVGVLDPDAAAKAQQMGRDIKASYLAKMDELATSRSTDEDDDEDGEPAEALSGDTDN